MKLIIDTKDNYKSLITSAWSYGVAPSRTVLEDVSKAVMNGIPLDDIKAEIDKLDFDFGDFYDHTEEIHEMIDKTWNKYIGK